MPDNIPFEEISNIKNSLNTAAIPPELRLKLEEEISRLEKISSTNGYSQEFVRVSSYVDWIISLPWDKRSEDILDLGYAGKTLNQNHYGLEPIKERVLEYLSVLKLKKEKADNNFRLMRAPILCFVGLAGTGKTTIASSIAQSMGRKFERIPFGGLGDPAYLRGQSRIHPESEPGQIIKALKRAGTKNPVILLDEIDRVVDEARATIMGVLVELLDPEQNMAFTDYYLDYPFDLSEVLFVATANNTANISTAVLDRLEPMMMPSYSDEEKITIAKDFVLPKTLLEAGLTKDNLVIDESVWPQIVRPLGYDAGIRTLERTINGLCRKVAKLIVEKKGEKFVLTADNIKEFLPSW